MIAKCTGIVVPRELDIYSVLLCRACKYEMLYNCFVQGNMVLPEAVIIVG